MLLKNTSKNIAQYALAVLLFLSVAVTQASADTHTESAFLFAKRGEWDEALKHAQQSSEKGAYDLVLWMALMDGEAEISSTTIREFIEDHADWPEQRKMQLRYEKAMLREGESPGQDLLSWFGKHPPVSGAGKLLLAQSMLASKVNTEQAKPLIREAWEHGDFTLDIEQGILQTYRTLFDSKLHQARADRLVWDGQYGAAKRMFPMLSAGYQRMIEARIALESRNKKAPKILAKVPASLLNNPGMVYSRLVWRDFKKDAKGAVAMLNAAPKENLPYPEKWWDYRQRYVRQAIDKKQYAEALKLLKSHGLEDGADFAEAVWLKGWILLEFQKNAADAYLQFDTLYRGVNFAVSKARAAYWAGRASEKMNEKEIAQSWFSSAAEYPTTFYGQLAYARIHPGKALELSSSSAKSAAAYSTFKSSDMARALALSMDYGRTDLAERLIRALVDNADSPDQMRNIAMLADEHHSDYLGVKAAKRALQYNVLIKEIAYPTLDYNESGLESPLAHAIIRQESEFNSEARSPAGALGFMQLMPGTAREVAKKEGMDTRALSITHTAINLKLGSTYLSKLIDGFDGSYVLAIASYNAGPGRVREWIRQFGSPSEKLDATVNWIEKIPYAETRNYVQRVMENLQVYRVILGGGKGTALKLEQDLVR